MKQNKSKKILIVCIIVMLILILVAGFAFAYIATDIFRSKKELFFKYGSQLLNHESGFIDSKIPTYFEKQKVTPYENEGIIKTEITNNNLEEELEYLDDFNISFTGKVDTSNSKSEQEISINYSEDVNFPINYRQNGNILGLQTKYIGSKYMAIESDDIEGLLSKFGINITFNTENVNDLSFSEEEINQLKTTYSNVINQQLKDEFFTKIITSNSTGYKLNLKGQDLKNIIITILETMKTDEMLLSKLNDYASLQDSSVEFNESSINEIISVINEDTEFEQNNIEIAVYQSNGNLNQFTIQINEDAKIDISKSVGIDEAYYNVVITTYEENSETAKIYFNAKYTGLQTMESVSENYEIGFLFPEENSDEESEKIEYKYIYNNQVNFVNDVSIEKFDDENSMILNDQSSEYLVNLFGAISERIQKVNKSQMEEIGLDENENPIIYLVPIVDSLGTDNGVLVEMENNQGDLDETAIATFNAKFEMYASKNSKGATTKGLLSTILMNNTYDDASAKIEEINFDGQEYEVTEQNITLIKSNINTEDLYKVEFEKDEETGLIYRVVINKV